MKINKDCFIWVCGLLFSIFIFSGCAGPKIYSINMYYDAEQVDIPENIQNKVKNTDTTISVSEFIDARQIEDNLVIGRVAKTDGSKILVFPRNIQVTKAISHGIRNYLKKAGYRVSEKIEPWDLKEENIPRGDSNVLIGGSIEDLEIYCRKGYLTNAYTSVIKLKVIFADMAKGKILYNNTIESSYSMEHVWFSENILSEQADIILADAIEQLFEDKAIAQKLKEAMAQ